MRPRARSRACSARTTPGPTASTAPSGTRRSPTTSTTSTRAASASSRSALAVVDGLVLLDLSGEAPPPAEHIGDLAPLLARYRTGELKRGAQIVYDVEANWKAIAENYNECLHCPGVHPELNRLSHYLSGEDIFGEGAWCGGSMTLTEGADTMGKEGGAAHNRPPIRGLTEQQQRDVLYFLLFPNTLVSLHPDYVMLHTMWPQARTARRSSASGSSSPRRCRWTASTRRTRSTSGTRSTGRTGASARITQLGMQSSGFEPGRYTSQEDHVHLFDVMVADRYLEALGAEVAR